MGQSGSTVNQSKSRWSDFRPVDWFALVYLIWLSAALLLSPRRPFDWWEYIAAHVVAALLLILACMNRDRLHPIPRFMYDWFPVWAIPLVFEELRHLIQLVVPHWFDPFFLKADIWLFGVFPFCFEYPRGRNTTTGPASALADTEHLVNLQCVKGRPTQVERKVTIIGAIPAFVYGQLTGDSHSIRSRLCTAR